MYIVDCDASLHMMRLPSQNNEEENTIRPSSKILDIKNANGIVCQTRKQRSTSRNLGAYLWVQLVETSPSVLSLGRLQCTGHF